MARSTPDDPSATPTPPEQAPSLPVEQDIAAPLADAVADPAPPAAEVEYIEVLVLRDEPAYGLRCGEVAVIDITTAEQLYHAGGVDPQPQAIAAAKANRPTPDVPDVIED